MIGEFVRDGIRIVMTTHDLGQARRLADEVVFLNRRMLIEQAPAASFFDQPRTAEGRGLFERRSPVLTNLNRRLFGALLAPACRWPLACPQSLRTDSSPWHRPPRPSSRACSIICSRLFKAKTGLDVHVVAQGTGQAIETGRRGDADVLFVHDTKSEEKFVADGFAKKRYDVMYNDFVIVGPAADPAGVKGMKDAGAALKKIAEAKAPFASRGDDSGTHKAEQRLWQMAGVDVAASGGWYRVHRLRHGTDAQHQRRDGCLCLDRPGELG